MGRPTIKRSLHLGCHRRRIICLVTLGLIAGAPAVAASGHSGTVVVKPVRVPIRITAYATVSPVVRIQLRSPERGLLSGLKLSPGDPVHAGQVIARMKGPQRAGSLDALRLQVRQTRVRLHLAKQEQTIARQKFREQLVTRKAVDRAEAERQRAGNNLAVAQSRLQSAQQARRVTVPLDGHVVRLAAADGQWLQAGQVVATVMPSRRVWLTATVFGRDVQRVHPGMSGRFQPADGGSSVAVHVVRLLPVADADGGRRLALRPDQPVGAGWTVGVAGRLALQGPKKSFMRIPTRALVLAQGQWWVVIQGPKGEQRRRVRPGPVEGDDTLIRSGLKPGERVVVADAYRHFHRDFARHYQPPD